METKKINTNGNSDKKKGGINNTQSTNLKVAGAAIAGAAGATLLANTFHGHPVNEPDHKEEPKPESETEQQATVNEELQATEQQTTENGEQQATAIQEDITQPQPTDNGGNGQNGNQSNQDNNNNNQQPNNNGGETPEEIAQKILSENNIDEEDIDAPNLFTVTEVGTVSNAEGQEVIAAMIEDQEGNIFYLADADNDGVFDGVYDQTLAFVQPAEGNLTMADIEDMASTGGGYLAINVQEQNQQQSMENPMEDIIDTNTGNNVNLAQNNQQQQGSNNEQNNGEQQNNENIDTGGQTTDEPSTEELLAALLGFENEGDEREVKEEDIIEEDNIEEVIDEDDTEDDEEEIVDDTIDAI